MSILCTIWLLVSVSVTIVASDEPTIIASSADLSLLINETSTLDVSIQGLAAGREIELQFWTQHDDLILVNPSTLSLDKNDQMYQVSVTGLQPGYVQIKNNTLINVI